MRLSTIIPFVVQNYALSVTSVNVVDYVIASAIGMLPGVCVYVYIGTTVTSMQAMSVGDLVPPEAMWALLITGIVVTLLMIFYVSHVAVRAIRKHGGVEEVDEDEYDDFLQEYQHLIA